MQRRAADETCTTEPPEMGFLLLWRVHIWHVIYVFSNVTNEVQHVCYES